MCYSLPISLTFHKLVFMKSIWYSAVTQPESIVALFFLTWGWFLYTCLKECFPSFESFYDSSHYCSLRPSLKNEEWWWCCWKSSIEVQGKVKVASDLGGIIHSFYVKNRFLGLSWSWITRLFCDSERNFVSKHQVCHQSGSDQSTTHSNLIFTSF